MRQQKRITRELHIGLAGGTNLVIPPIEELALS
jgi:hypothetical protein